MIYKVVDAVGQQVEVEASTPRSAQERAKRLFKHDPVGHLAVFEQIDARKNVATNNEFFGAAPRIIL